MTDDLLPPELIKQAKIAQARRRRAGLSTDHGFKHAYIAESLGRTWVGFEPLRVPGYLYGVSADATCLFKKVFPKKRKPIACDHTSPHPACQCGFYALIVQSHLGITDTRSWVDEGHERYVATLEVELSGKLIAGQVGFRAEHIEVFRVILPNRCISCGKPAHRLRRKRKSHRLVPCCNAPACSQDKSWPLSWLRDQLGTQVEWAQALHR